MTSWLGEYHGLRLQQGGVNEVPHF